MNAETRTVPSGASLSARSASSAASMRSRITRAWPASATPASVSATDRPWRSISAVPLSRSRAASCCDTADGLNAAALRHGPDRPEALELDQQAEAARIEHC